MAVYGFPFSFVFLKVMKSHERALSDCMYAHETVPCIHTIDCLAGQYESKLASTVLALTCSYRERIYFHQRSPETIIHCQNKNVRPCSQARQVKLIHLVTCGTMS